MKVNPAEPSSPPPYANRVPRDAGDSGVSEREAAVEMIENAEVKPPESDEKGKHVNTVA